MGWFIFLAWVVGSALTFRHVGYSINQAALRGGSLHEYQSICHSCKCTGCGRDAWDHSGRRPCRDEQWEGNHIFFLFLALVISAAFWIPLAVGYVSLNAARLVGLSGGDILAPAPKVKTLAERRQAKIEAEEKRLADLQQAIAEAEAESERQLARQRALGLPV